MAQTRGASARVYVLPELRSWAEPEEAELRSWAEPEGAEPGWAELGWAERGACLAPQMGAGRGGSPAIDLEPVLLDQAMDIVAIDPGLGGRARDVAAVAREQRGEVVALEALDQRGLGLLERQNGR